MPGLSLGLGLGLSARNKGGGAPNPIVTRTTMRDAYVMRDSIRMTDNG